ncbi:MAG: adenylate kinase [Bacillota bacterium]
MNLILLGPPGAGKGTQAKLISARHGIPHISTGDIFRAAIAEGTPLGRQAREFLDRGALVPDEIVIGIVTERLGAEDCRPGFLLDGFPRTLPQAEALDRYLAATGRTLTAVLALEVGEEVLIRRLGGRRVCRACGAPYHIETNPPREEGRCDRCGGELYQRDDDRPATVRERLRVYEAQTRPLLDYYEERGLLKRIQADGGIEEVDAAIERALAGGGRRD